MLRDSPPILAWAGRSLGAGSVYTLILAPTPATADSAASLRSDCRRRERVSPSSACFSWRPSKIARRRACRGRVIVRVVYLESADPVIELPRQAREFLGWQAKQRIDLVRD